MIKIEVYREVEISYNDEKNRFEANINGMRMRYHETLKGLKQSIDNALDSEPAPEKQEKRPALLITDRSYGDSHTSFERKTITSFGQRKGAYGSRYTACARVSDVKRPREWEFVDCGHLKDLVIDNESNIKKLMEIKSLEEERDKRSKEFNDKINEVRESLERYELPEHLPAFD